MPPNSKIDIRPQVSVLSVLKHLNYDPWFALGEFVDNSIQSWREHRQELEEAHGGDFTLSVEIEVDRATGGSITVRDNAAGIFEHEYARAFRPAEMPPDTSGLAEFGMGMKSAACWFASRWNVRSTALGEGVERTVSFDVDSIVENEVQELDVESSKVPSSHHYTVVTLEELHQIPRGRTVGKIKDHLSSIYRHFTRDEELELFYNGERLEYQQPEILVAPYYQDEEEDEVRWKKPIEFDLGRGLYVDGFAAIREEGSTSEAGFSLFRRGRVVEGSADEKYRPEEIFGKSNSFRYQRVFGELHLEGFDVSHTKDGFVWAENEEPFLELLYEELNSEPLPLLKQAENYRALSKKDKSTENLEKATKRTAEAIQEEGQVLDELDEDSVAEDPPAEMPTAEVRSRRLAHVELEEIPWRIILEASDDPSISDWVTLSEAVIQKAEEVEEVSLKDVGVRMALEHPFTLKFAGPDLSEIEPLVRLAAAIGLAEAAARESGVREASIVRRNINKLLADAFSEMED